MLMQLRGGMCGDVHVLSTDAVEQMLADRIGEVYGGETGRGLADLVYDPIEAAVLAAR
jgi:hypothetical protein